eukprot:CAMPEP_0170496806 /NCGR_PEP_ID=MMETSP0208-20121228/22751_1 /TAXON_ID=197538 /ORGANISM="Strombidium inclinatum, Strain S3" /LENGTH=116 /DNA_ID=CAMNT_0010773435 /DNA_START=186 /DNA_END=536 /DNA_ORIENTATION=-
MIIFGEGLFARLDLQQVDRTSDRVGQDGQGMAGERAHFVGAVLVVLRVQHELVGVEHALVTLVNCAQFSEVEVEARLDSEELEVSHFVFQLLLVQQELTGVRLQLGVLVVADLTQV